MIIFKKTEQLSKFMSEAKGSGKKVGFAPTMGALHKGHLSLIRSSLEENDLTVCSIFVNPTQFNNPEDFRHYPVTIEKDIEQLTESGCDILFLPPVTEIYSGYTLKKYDLGWLETMYEGQYRPGHFQGVCQVVDRLLSIIQPNKMYLGQKDFQQCMVIKRLVDLMAMDKLVSIHIVPTLREPDGLAMSSRNLRLNGEERKKAPAIYQQLLYIKKHLKEQPLQQLVQQANEQLNADGFMVDYIAVVKATDLLPPDDLNVPLVILAAASIGTIRLIDNVSLN